MAPSSEKTGQRNTPDLSRLGSVVIFSTQQGETAVDGDDSGEAAMSEETAMSEKLHAKLPKKRAEILATPLSALNLPKPIRVALEKENAFREKLGGYGLPPIVTVKDWLAATPHTIRGRGRENVLARIDAECEKLGVTLKVREDTAAKAAVEAEDRSRAQDRAEWAFDDWCAEHRDLLEKMRKNPEIVERIRKELEQAAQ